MGDRTEALRRIDQLIARLPARPIKDNVVQQAARPWAQIAALYDAIDDDDAAAEWYRKGAEWAHACGDILGAIVLLKGSLELRPDDAQSRALYDQLSQLGELGDASDFID